MKIEELIKYVLQRELLEYLELVSIEEENKESPCFPNSPKNRNRN